MPANTNAATSWNVTGDMVKVVLSASGGVTNGHEILYTTGAGNQGTVFVPDAVYVNLSALKAAVHDAAVHTDAVASLSSSS